jgi:hypothetical protein
MVKSTKGCTSPCGLRRIGIRFIKVNSAINSADDQQNTVHSHCFCFSHFDVLGAPTSSTPFLHCSLALFLFLAR